MRAFITAAVVLASALAPLVAPAQGRPAGVATEVVSTRQMAETVSVFGQVVAGRESAVAARVAGLARDVPIQVGTRVRRGDVLARMDTELLEIELARAEAGVAIAEAGVAVVQARLDRAEKALRRAENLRANSTIAEAQLEDREGEYAELLGSRQEAEARLQSARNALGVARYNVENATVRAPFSGVVLQVATEIGQYVAAGSEVATIVDTGSMEVEANVPARFVDALSADRPVEARTDAGGALTLTLRAILPTEFSATRTRPVLFDIPRSEGSIAAGQSVTLEVPVSAPREVVVVPKDALVQGRDGWSVFVNEGGTAAPRNVEIGAALDDTFEVLSGLVPGDEVVTRGNERLRPGQPIAPQNAPQGAPAGSGPDAGDDAGNAGDLPADAQRAQNND